MSILDGDVAVSTGLGLDVRPMSGHTGAEIHGVDLRGPLSADVVAGIRHALLRWKVVFFRGQELTQAQHVAFGRCFGELLAGHPTLPSAFPEHPEVLLLDNRSAGMGEGHNIESDWHVDVSFTPAPPMGSILRGVVVPPYGGDTQFANLVVAYERLSEPLRVLVDGLHAVHHNRVKPIRGDLPSALAKQFTSTPLRAVHPVVRVHPETGERALFVNPTFTSHIVELSRREGAHLLGLLYEHLADTEFTVRFRWEPGSIAFWDNRAVVHKAPTDVPPGHHRSMQRVTLAGDVVTGPDGVRATALTD